MSIFKNTFEHRVFYNKFIETYKQTSHKVSAVNDIKTHRDVLADQEKELTDQVANRVEELKTISNAPPGSSDPQEREYHTHLKQSMKQVVTAVEKEVERNNHIQNPKKTLETLQGVIKNSFDEKFQSFYPATKCVQAIEEICRSGEQVAVFREKQRLLNKIIQEALNEDYPNQLSGWRQLPQDEKQELRGDVLMKHENKKKDYSELMPLIVKFAVDIIDADGKSLSYYVTESNEINSKLYGKIYTKIPDSVKDRLTIDRLRGWLKTDYRSGKLEKLIQEEREKDENT